MASANLLSRAANALVAPVAPQPRRPIQISTESMELEYPSTRLCDHRYHPAPTLCSDMFEPSNVHNIQEGPWVLIRERFIETSAICRDIGPGGHGGKKGKTGGVETDWKHECDRKYFLMHGRWCSKDSATTSARCKSKRLKTQSLPVPLWR
jgi:hypothetical protein